MRNFKIKKGEMIGIVGESGSGKSTLARQIIRLEKPTSGQVLLNNKDITNIKGKELKNIYKDMQMVFQDPIGSFDPRLTIGKSIDELLKNNKVPKNIRKENILKFLLDMGILYTDEQDWLYKLKTDKLSTYSINWNAVRDGNFESLKDIYDIYNK